MDTLFPDEYRIRPAQAAVILGVGVATLWRWAAVGAIPRPVKIGNTSSWSMGELRAIIRKHEEKSRGVAA